MNSINLQVVPTLPTTDHVLFGYLQSVSTDNLYSPDLIDLVKSSDYYANGTVKIQIAKFNSSPFTCDVNFTNTSKSEVTSTQVGTMASEGEYLYFNINTKLITPKEITTLNAGTWGVVVENGLLVDTYSVSGNEVLATNNQSWVANLIDSSGDIVAGDLLVLLYTLPEVGYPTATTTTDNKFPTGTKTVLGSEMCETVASDTVIYKGELRTLRKIYINNVLVFDDVYIDVPSGIVKVVNYDDKSIKITTTLKPQDVVSIVYETNPQNYLYTGYGNNVSGTKSWYNFDCNPEYAHQINDYYKSYTTENLLDKQIVLYADPASVLRIRFTPYVDPIGSNFGLVDIKAFSGLEQTDAVEFFLRHKVYSSDFEFKLKRIAFNSSNSWGYANLGVNFYDENVNNSLFDEDLPYALPIAKILLSSKEDPFSRFIKNEKTGGGIEIPEDQINLTEQEEFLVKSLLNVGNWGGASVAEGGEVLVKLDAAVLTKLTEEEVNEVVKRHMPPGILFTIKYI